jgi:hypothetical protein
MRSLRWVGAALLLCLAVPGCKQGVGDRCQVQSDCDDGLLCVLPNGGTPQSGGTCEMPTGFDGNFGTDLAAHADAADTD